jgi:hypothetical protein
MVVQSLSSRDGVADRSYASVELVFRVVPTDSPEAKSASLERAPDGIIETRSR